MALSVLHTSVKLKILSTLKEKIQFCLTVIFFKEKQTNKHKKTASKQSAALRSCSEALLTENILTGYRLVGRWWGKGVKGQDKLGLLQKL